LVERGLVESRAAARRAIETGRVTVDGVIHPTPRTRVGEQDSVVVTGGYVGRGGEKLAAALTKWPYPVRGRRVLDAGASTGGFTQVLLDNGAAQVVALDVGRDQLHPSLRHHPKVAVHEGVNLRYVDPEDLGGPFDTLVVDLSFISLCTVADALARLASPGAQLLALAKPQFELERGALTKAGTVRLETDRLVAIEKVAACLEQAGFAVLDRMDCPTVGRHGNREVFLWCRR
jgi:23S rRNA (cytidine1920-2'-O)/16S rRNA (cytidine1409-2'-O)-methyltransferase